MGNIEQASRGGDRCRPKRVTHYSTPFVTVHADDLVRDGPTMLQAEQLPGRIAHLDSGLPDVNTDHFPL